jgi:hypothetical protein
MLFVREKGDRMNKSMLTLVIALGVTATAQARLGETKKQVFQRYGTPMWESPDRSAWRFKKNDIRIFVRIPHTKANQGNVAREVRYEKTTVYTEDQLTQLLAANSEGATWKETRPGEGSAKQWVRHGGRAILDRDKSNDGLYVFRFYGYPQEGPENQLEGL